ncbi:hypothetical protein EMIHUDRAFT_206436 [Emiliania huxleyi CCMP1516]|uniref:EF-hand domain-containing protein n=2 Tax=Emiliania huxleyi TaxID=2903 RepID=A0A0D3JNZ8_EMIH1|nr:hypothetical protein EMIHUDRAFT_206436 [Emiliania huxleyi CCMP1516]EOD25233.1 hypothetical protein EMIHUDRAFT_206436 [Emiliania huxleyi CCMP1516]|eukprot:XP_005777662.1 hypothetical protein EMIHUDRAFT_206436 [Emiliania huxleyi CCMP1516]
MFDDYYEPEDSGRGRPPLVHALTESIGPCAHYDEDDLMCELYTVDSVVWVTLIVLSESPEGATHIATVAKQPSFLASVAEKLEVDSAGLHFVEQPSTAGPVRVDAPSPPPLQRLLRGQRSEVEILDATFDFVDLADHALPEHREAWRASGEAEKMRLEAAELLAILEQLRDEERSGTVSKEKFRAYAERERARGSGGRLRFAPGDRVRCKIRLQDGSEFAPTGRVTQLRPVGAGQGAPYQVLLDDGRYVYPREDDDEYIKNATGPPGRRAADLCFVAGYQAGLGGRAVLTAEEVEALLSGEGLDLLRDVSETFNDCETRMFPDVSGGGATLLRGFVVRCRAAVLLPGEPLYAPARIVGVHKSEARLDLDIHIDGKARLVRGVPLWRLSNAIGAKEASLLPGPQRIQFRVFDPAYIDYTRVRAVALALSCGEGAERLDRLVVRRTSARSGVAAIDKWRELLMRAGVCEDEPAAGDTRPVTVGEYSHHAILYSRLHGAHEALVDFLIEITDPGMENAEVWQRWLVERYDEWPLERRGVAVEWLEWLLRPDERRAGFPALCGFIAHENGLSREEHIARDDPGRFSLVRAADDALSGCVHELVEDGKMESLPAMGSPGCAICPRVVRSCARWAQLRPCGHWLVDVDAEDAHP